MNVERVLRSFTGLVDTFEEAGSVDLLSKLLPVMAGFPVKSWDRREVWRLRQLEARVVESLARLRSGGAS